MLQRAARYAVVAASAVASWAALAAGQVHEQFFAPDSAARNGSAIVWGGTFAGHLRLGSREFVARERDGFVAKSTRDGRVMWARAIGGGGNESVGSLSVTSDGDVIVTGNVSAASGFYFGAGRVAAQGRYDAFVARYSSTGHLVWVRRSALAGLSGGVIGADGDVFIAGSFGGSTLEPGAGPLVNAFPEATRNVSGSRTSLEFPRFRGQCGARGARRFRRFRRFFASRSTT